MKSATIPSEFLKEDADKSDIKILEAARALYAEFGLRRTTMDDVAKRAGVGRATLYRRFSEKEQLFKAVLLRDLQRDLFLIEKEIEQVNSALEGVLQAFIKSTQLLDGNDLIRRLLVTEPEQVLPYLTTDFETILSFARGYLSGQIERGQRRGEVRQGNPDALAEMILRLLQSFLLTPDGALNPSDETNMGQFVEQFLRPLLSPAAQ